MEVIIIITAVKNLAIATLNLITAVIQKNQNERKRKNKKKGSCTSPSS
ncbi:hypothetical protein HNR27_000577 [Ornithinibacillus bavariensis]